MKVRDRVKELRRVRASELIPNPKNWRVHPGAQADALRGVLAEIGYADALLARETPEGLMLVDGHLRAETTPDAEVPVLVLDVTEEEADYLMSTLDPLAGMARADDERLQALLDGLHSEDAGVAVLLQGLRDGIKVEPQVGLTDPDAMPEAVEPVAKRGDVWICGDHRVMCGDSTDEADVARLMAGEKADLIVTDPPYGVDVQERDMQQAEVRGRRKDGKGVTNDNLTGDALGSFLEAAFGLTRSFTRPGACWYVCAPSGVDYRLPLNVLSALDIARHGIVWVKDRFVMGRADYHYRHENIIYGWTPGAAHLAVPTRIQDSVWEFVRPGRSPEHPTMKPVALIERAITNSSRANAVVIDPFLGSGTTMIAAERLGRRCYGMEIEPRYVDAAVRRWEDFTGRKAELSQKTEGKST